MHASQYGQVANGHRPSATTTALAGVPNFSQAAQQNSNLVYQGLCLICNVAHGPSEQCPALYSKISIRLALDELKMSAMHGRAPPDVIALKRAILLEYLRTLETQRS
jgi:hypothetical protein